MAATSGVVTVLGAAGHIIPVTVNGSYAFSLAQSYAAAVNTASSSGTLFAAEGNGAGVPAAGGSAINEYVANQSGYYTFPSGYDHFVTDTTSHVFIDATAGSAGTTLSTLVGTGGATYLAGNESGTFIAGGGNNLFINTGAGAYTVAASDGNDSIFAGSGATSIYGGTGDNLITLGSGADTVVSEGTDRIIAGTGDDTITLSGSSSTIYGGIGSSRIDDSAATGTSLVGGSGTTLISTGGLDSYYNLNGVSTVFAGIGDTIAASGATTVYGAANNSFNETGTSSLLFIGGAGDATVNSAAGTATVFGTSGSDIFYKGTGTLVAGSGNETLNGSGSTQGFAGFVTNTLSPTAITGAEILGGSGADTLVAGMGVQTLGGGAGDNQFIIAENGTMSSATITISDFGSSAGNMVYLYGYGAGEVSKALSTATVSGGNTKITLGDNSTITFLGVSSLDSTKFAGG